MGPDMDKSKDDVLKTLLAVSFSIIDIFVGSPEVEEILNIISDAEFDAKHIPNQITAHEYRRDLTA